MTTYHTYENVGTLDIRAVTMMGVNAKPNTDSPIGYFGTGLKMAIAVLMRFNAAVTIEDGQGNVYAVNTKPFEFREKEFMGITLFNVTTGETFDVPYTTELGKDWDLWMAMRELECNAMDEDGRYIAYEDNVPQIGNGIVRITVCSPAYDHVINHERKNVFIHAMDHKDVEQHTMVDVLVGRPSHFIYYRGIRVYRFIKELSHTYNFKCSLELTEDRQIKYYWTALSYLNDLWSKFASPAVINRLVGNANAGEWYFWEHTNIESYSDSTCALLDEANKRGVFIGEHQQKMLAHVASRKAMQRSYEMVDDESAMLEAGIGLALLAGFPADDYTIRVVEDIPGNVLGMADFQKIEIIISRRNFENGLECVAGTLIEEYIHLRYGHPDESRALQDLLLRRLVKTTQRMVRALEKEGVNADTE